MVGKKIKHQISISGLSVSEVAEQLHISPQNLYKIFKKESVESKYLIKLAELLKIPISNFFPGEGTRIQQLVSSEYNTGVFLHKYFNERFKIEKSNLPEDTKKILLKRKQFLIDKLARFSRLESMFRIIEEIERYCFNGTPESTQAFIKHMLGVEFPTFFDPDIVKQVIQEGLIINEQLKEYLINLIEKSK